MAVPAGLPVWVLPQLPELYSIVTAAVLVVLVACRLELCCVRDAVALRVRYELERALAD